MYEKVLVAVDGSPKSFKALEYASKLVESTCGSLVVLHVIKQLKENRRFSNQELIDGIKEGKKVFAERVLEEAKGKLGPVALARGKFIRLTGAVPAKVIVATAKKEACDAIVIGSRGLGGAESVLLGSVSSAVLNMTNLPVLVVK